MNVLVLNSTNKSIEVLLSGAVTTNQLQYTAHYADATTTAFLEGASDGVTNNTTAVTMIAAPAASTQRIVREITVHNADTVAATITVRLNSGGSYRIIYKGSLAVGDTWALSGVTTSVSDGDKGDITVSGGAWTIDNDVVTFAKMQNITDARLLGRSAGSSGDAQEISIGENMTLANGVLSGIGKNRIINGRMEIDQRNAGAAVTVNSAARTYGVDRFFGYGQATDGVFTMQHDTVAPAGFINSLKVTVTTADASVGASQFYYFGQSIEGLNCTDLAFGSASAKTITLSFWVRSSVTGTFGGALLNSAANRSYPFTYSISSANTWEQKTVTIAGDTSGTWLTTNEIGLNVVWDLGCGSSNLGTAGAWAGAGYYGATGGTKLISTLNATWYITGVQVEVGSVATIFELKSYGQELALCQRYYYKISKLNWAVSSSSDGDSIVTGIPFPVTMRAEPSFTNDYVNGVYDSAGPSAGKWCFNKPYVSNSTKTGTISTGAVLQTYGAEVYFYGATFSPAPTAFNTPDSTLAMKFSAEL